MNEPVPRSRFPEKEQDVARRIDLGRKGSQPPLSQGETGNLAEDAGLPVAILRDVGSYYSAGVWKNQRDSVVQVCDGTSCRLGGGKRVETMMHRYGHECQRVYCLGFCDQSPISMIPFDQMRAQNPTSIRNFAPEAIATRRILADPVCDMGKASEVGVYSGLIRALQFPPSHLIEELKKSGERDRGGTGFTTGKKMRIAAESISDQKYVIANGDEGDPGSFLDRVLMEQDPHTVIEGMVLSGYAIGGSEGIIYIRAEYPRAVEIMHEAVANARREGYLGKNICDSGFDFEIRIFIGKDSYVCGEETALIASLEGLRSKSRLRPPYPSQVGLRGKPTVVLNVETLTRIPFIALKGGEAYAFYGTHASTGTKAICLNHGFQNPGLVEVEFGITFREVIEEIGGGGRDGEPLAAVLLGGPMGTILKPDEWDYPICYAVLDRHGIQLGHGGLVAIPESADFRDLLIHFTEFMIRESYGKSIPRQLGSEAFLKAIDENRPISDLVEILAAIEEESSGVFEQFVPGPIRTLLADFPERIFGENQNIDQL